MVAAAVDHEAIERDVVRLGRGEKATYLQRTLGQKVVAYACGLKDAKMVGHWSAGRDPRPLAALKLDYLYHAVRVIDDAYGMNTAQAWLFGTNSKLGNHAPASTLRSTDDPEAMQWVVRAALSFVEGAF